MSNCFECKEPLGPVALNACWQRVQRKKEWVKVVKVYSHYSNSDDQTLKLTHFDCIESRVRKMENR